MSLVELLVQFVKVIDEQDLEKTKTRIYQLKIFYSLLSILQALFHINLIIVLKSLFVLLACPAEDLAKEGLISISSHLQKRL